MIGWGFIGTGLYTWAKRPDNSLGSLMVATGFAWLVAGLGSADSPVLFTIAGLFGSVWVVTTMHTLLAAPDGKLARGDRRIIIAAYLLVTVGVLPLWLFYDPSTDCENCPENVFMIADSETAVDILGTAINVIAIVLLVLVVRSLVRRWRRATRAERRLYAPMYGAGIALMLALLAQISLQSAGSRRRRAHRGLPRRAGPLRARAVPVHGRVHAHAPDPERRRGGAGGAPERGAARSGTSATRSPRRSTTRRWSSSTGCPSAAITWTPPAARVELPEDGPGRCVTKIERDGECVAAIVHDSTMPEVRQHAERVGAAAALALENERLDAELRAKIDELRASRERMLRIGLEERRRLERDLHDGAQQRLVSMALNIRLARAKLNADPLAADRLLESAGTELDSALEELRELARGIHPAVLSDRGLGTALETLASRAPVPVELAELPDERLPEAVELAAYFVVAEALTNVAKYAKASHATVEVARENGRVLVEVADDGVGGADPEGGTGLRGLADRLAVLEGRLEIQSEQGRGTTIRARIPCV